MNNKRLETILEKIKEALKSTLPIALIILLLAFTICPLPNDIFMAFVVGTCLLVVGLGLFSLGAEMSMERIGAHVGANLTRSRKIPIIAILSLIVGVLMFLKGLIQLTDEFTVWELPVWVMEPENAALTTIFLCIWKMMRKLRRITA